MTIHDVYPELHDRERIARRYAEVSDWVTKFRYKPGYSFEVHATSIIAVSLLTSVPDSYYPWDYSRPIYTQLDRQDESMQPVYEMVRSDDICAPYRTVARTRMVRLGQRESVPWHLTEPRDFYLWLRSFIIRAEVHEIDEWINVDGDVIFNPHDPAKAIHTL